MGLYTIKNLRDIRTAKYEKIKDMAMKCNFSEKTVQRSENGRDRVSLYTIGQIAMALGMDKEAIIDKERSSSSNKYKKNKHFYGKGKINHPDQIYTLVESTLRELLDNEKLESTDNIIPNRFETIDKIIRCSLATNENISQYVKDNIMEFFYLRELFIILTYILINCIDDEVSEEEVKDQINDIHKEILLEISLLEKLDELYGFKRVTYLRNMVLDKYKITDKFQKFKSDEDNRT